MDDPWGLGTSMAILDTLASRRHQEENQNGKVINDFLERNDVVLLNIDERCEGVYSWERGTTRVL